MSGPPSGWQDPKVTWAAGNVVTAQHLNDIGTNLNAIETGSRTLDQALASPANTGTLRQILSWFAGRIRAITGTTNWWEAPDTTLAAAKSHIDATTAHSAVSAATASRIVVRDAAGRAAFVDGSAAGDAATKGQLDTHAALTTAHSATAAATADRIVLRDAAGRAQVVAPSAAADIARKDTVDAVQTNLTTHAGTTTGTHGVGASTVESAAGATAKVNVVRYPSINVQTTSYTLVLADDAKIVDMNSASALILTVPTNAAVAFPVGAQIVIAQGGAGKITLTASSGVTLRAAGNRVRTTEIHAVCGLIKVATDTWCAFGSLEAV